MTSPDQTFEDLGLDSLAFVEIQLAIQQEYDFTIPDEDAAEITSIGDGDRLRQSTTCRRWRHKGMPTTDNSTEIKAPLETVWERMNDVENWPNLFTEYASAEVIERNGDTIKFRLTTFPDPGVRRPGVELGLGADGRSGQPHRQGTPDRDRPVRVT